ncbi:MAG: hypothetical protein WA040_00475 [Anaerolineae bacterium]
MPDPNVETTADDDMLPEYDFTGGVRGKHYKAMREGYAVKINQADGTTLVKRFKAELWESQIEADLEAGRVDVLLAEAEKEHVAGLSQPL